MCRDSECTKCKLGSQCHSVCVWGEWWDDADYVEPDVPVVVCIAEAPGREEDAQCRTLIGKSGKLFRRILEEVDVGNVYLANVVKCRPPSNRTPHLKEVRACRDYLEEELDSIRPDFIVLLGGTAIKAFTGERTASVGLNRNRQAWEYEGSDGAWSASVIATYHPAAACYGDSSVIPKIVDDLLRIKSREFLRPETPKYTILNEVQPKHISKVIAFDLETIGLNPFDSATKGDVLCVAWSGKDNEAYVTTNVDSFLSAVDKKHQSRGGPVTLVAHNAKFDLLWLGMAYKWWYSGQKKSGESLVYDTMTMQHLVDENLPSKGLKYLSSIHTGYGDYSKGVTPYLTKGQMKLLDKPDLLRYCAFDASATFKIYKILAKQIKQEKLTNLLEEQMALMGTVIDMEQYGIQVDHERLTTLKGKMSARLRKLTKLILKHHPDIENPDSPKKVTAYLYDTLGLPVVSKTLKGSPSADEGALRNLLHVLCGSPEQENAAYGRLALLEWLLERRKLKKTISTYFDGTEEVMDGSQVVHPNFNLCGTVTGRFSCSKPNLQNIPREGNSPVKQIFVSRPGNKLIQADYSQIELRVGAYLSRDRNMLQALRDGDDLHERTASSLYNTDNVTKDQRTVGKTINFGIFYGMGPKRLHETTGIKLREASKFIKAWYRLYPGVRDWLGEVEEELLDKGYVTSIFGRRRRLPINVTNDVGAYKHMLRQACNFPVQSVASELTQMAMISIGQYAQVVGNVHDSVLVECAEREVGLKREIIKRVMEHPSKLVKRFGFKVDFDLPTPVDIVTGACWGELE